MTLDVVLPAREVRVEVEVGSESLAGMHGIEPYLGAADTAVVHDHVVGRSIDHEPEVKIPDPLVRGIVHDEPERLNRLLLDFLQRPVD